jgi:DNA-binding transcriptional LysR family regulator
VLPRDVDPPFSDALVSMCREADRSPDFLEVGQGGVEHALLAVAAGAGIALVPRSVAERYSPPGIRFVALEGSQPAIRCAVLTDPAVEQLGVHAFLRALARVISGKAPDIVAAMDAQAA